MSRKQKTLLQTWRQQAEKPSHSNFVPTDDLSTFSNDGVFKVPRPVQSHALEFSGFDCNAGETWIYPTNYPFREYQFSIVKEALFKNTMVILPTGLGKTFIAAVIMYNIYRWYPEGKVVFMAPTKPLVAQQVDSCFRVTGIPEEHTTQMTGQVSPHIRKNIWQRKRVFFLTPQVMANDLVCNICPAESIKCLVVDEAHKALGNHAYCQVVKELLLSSSHFRVLALTATPGSDIQAVKLVVENLLISHVELRTEDSPDVLPYTHTRDIEKIVVPLGECLTSLKSKFLDIINIYLKRLVQRKAMTAKNPSSLSKFQIFKLREAFSHHPPNNMDKFAYGLAMADFSLCISLYYAYELLCFHGVRPFYTFLIGIINGDKSIPHARSELRRNHEFEEIMKSIETDFIPEKEALKSPFQSPDAIVNRNRVQKKLLGHPKLEKMEELVLKHFKTFSGEQKDTRVMIFSQYRDSVQEITELLNRLQPLVKVMSFIGQATKSGNSVGHTQKHQLQVIEQFRKGIYNTLVSTCVGEEGLDIGEVDLIIAFDAPKSPIRLVQRMGRTGRLRKGQIILLVTEGKEEQMYNSSVSKKKHLNTIISKKFSFTSLYQNNPALIPPGIKPVCVKTHIEIKPKKVIHTKALKKKKGSELTDEELKEFNDLFKTEPLTKPLLPKSTFVTLKKGPQQDQEQSHLSLDKWTLWQDSPQQSYMVSHSHRCCILTETMYQIHFPDAKRKPFSHREMATNMIQTKNLPSISSVAARDTKDTYHDLEAARKLEEQKACDQKMAENNLMDLILLDEPFEDQLMEDLSIPGEIVCLDGPFEETSTKNTSIHDEVICLDEPLEDSLVRNVSEGAMLEKPEKNLVCASLIAPTPKYNLMTSLFGLSYTASETSVPKTTTKHFLNPPPSVVSLSCLRPNDISSVNIDEIVSNSSNKTHSVISVLNKKIKAKLKRKSKEPGNVLFDDTVTSLDASFTNHRPVITSLADLHHRGNALSLQNQSISGDLHKSEVAIEFDIDFDFPATFPGSSQCPQDNQEEQTNDVCKDNFPSEVVDKDLEITDDLNFTFFENDQVETNLDFSKLVSDGTKEPSFAKQFPQGVLLQNNNSVFDSLFDNRINKVSQIADASEMPPIFDESSNDNSSDIFEQLCFTNKTISDSLETSFTLPLKVKDVISDKTPSTRPLLHHPSLSKVSAKSTKEGKFPVKNKAISSNKTVFQSDKLSEVKYAPSPLLAPKRIMELAEEVGLKKVGAIETDKTFNFQKAKVYKAGETKPEALIESIRKRIAEERKEGKIKIQRKPLFQAGEIEKDSGTLLTSQKTTQSSNCVSESKIAPRKGLFQTAQILLKKPENKNEKYLVSLENKLDLEVNNKDLRDAIATTYSRSSLDSNKNRQLIENNKDGTSAVEKISRAVEKAEPNMKVSDIHKTSACYDKPLELNKLIVHQLDSHLIQKSELNKKTVNTCQPPFELDKSISNVNPFDSLLNKTEPNKNINRPHEFHSNFKYEKELQHTSKSKIQNIHSDNKKHQPKTIESAEIISNSDTSTKDTTQYTITQIISLIDDDDAQQKNKSVLNQSSEDEIVCPTPTKWSRRKLSKFSYRSSDDVNSITSNFSIFGKIESSGSVASAECPDDNVKEKGLVDDVMKMTSPQKLMFDISFGFPSSAEAIANFFADDNFEEVCTPEKVVLSEVETNLGVADTVSNIHSNLSGASDDHAKPINSSKMMTSVSSCWTEKSPVNRNINDNPFLSEEQGSRNVELDFSRLRKASELEQKNKYAFFKEKETSVDHRSNDCVSKPFIPQELSYRNVESNPSLLNENSVREKNSKFHFSKAESFEKTFQNILSKEHRHTNAPLNSVVFKNSSVDELKIKNVQMSPHLNEPFQQKQSIKNAQQFPDLAKTPVKKESIENLQLTHRQSKLSMSNRTTRNPVVLHLSPIKEASVDDPFFKEDKLHSLLPNDISTANLAKDSWSRLTGKENQKCPLPAVSELNTLQDRVAKVNKLKRSYVPPDSDDDNEDFKVKKKPKRHDSSSVARKKISPLKCKETKKDNNHKKRKNVFLLTQAKVSGSEGTDESEDENNDHLEQSFINDESVPISYTEQHAFYLESIKSNVGHHQKFKLKYNNEDNVNIFSQPVEDDGSYLMDSFCVDDDDFDSPVREKGIKRNKNGKIASKRRRIAVDSSSDEESNGLSSKVSVIGGRKDHNDSGFSTIASPSSKTAMQWHKVSHKSSNRRNAIVTSTSESESSEDDSVSHDNQSYATVSEHNHSRDRNVVNSYIVNSRDAPDFGVNEIAAKQAAASLSWVLSDNKTKDNTVAAAKVSMKNTNSVGKANKAEGVKKISEEIASLSWVLNEINAPKGNTSALAKAGDKSIGSVTAFDRKEFSSAALILNENETVSANTASRTKSGANTKQEVPSLSWVLNENKSVGIKSKLPVNHVDRGVAQTKKDANEPSWVRSGIKAIRTDNTAALAKADTVSFDISWTLDEEKSANEKTLAPSSSHIVASSYTLPSKPLVILVDSRQLASAKTVISSLRKTHKADPVVMSLGAIDYVLSNRVAAARVLDSEFKSAYTPQRIIDKIRAMCQSYDRSYVVIETDTRKQQSLGFNKGGCRYSEFASSILLQTGTHVLCSESAEETAQLLYSLAEKEKKGNFHINVPVHSVSTNQDLFNFYVSLPHVNIACALNLLYRYPSLSMLLKSSVEELKKVAFLAHHKAEAIWHYLNTDTSFKS